MKRWHAILLVICLFLVGWVDAPPEKINWIAGDGADDARC